MELGVGAPGPPSLGQVGGARGIASEKPQGVADADVGREEHVGVTQGSQGDVVGGPGSDAGDRQQVAAYVVAVRAAVQPELAVGEGPTQRDQCAAARPRS